MAFRTRADLSICLRWRGTLVLVRLAWMPFQYGCIFSKGMSDVCVPLVTILAPQKNVHAGRVPLLYVISMCYVKLYIFSASSSIHNSSSIIHENIILHTINILLHTTLYTFIILQIISTRTGHKYVHHRPN